MDYDIERSCVEVVADMQRKKDFGALVSPSKAGKDYGSSPVPCHSDGFGGYITVSGTSNTGASPSPSASWDFIPEHGPVPKFEFEEENAARSLERVNAIGTIGKTIDSVNGSKGVIIEK